VEVIKSPYSTGAHKTSSDIQKAFKSSGLRPVAWKLLVNLE